MRILHVIDAGARSGPGGGTLRPGYDLLVQGVAMLLRELRHKQAVCVVGRPEAAARAVSLGVPVHAAIPLNASRRPMETVTERLGPFEVAQVWGSGATARLSGGLGRAGRLIVADPPHLSPPVEPRRSSPVVRAAVRRSLGIHDHEVAVLLVGDPPQADAMRFIFMMSLLAVAGQHAVGIAPAGVAQVARADRFARSAGRTRVAVSGRRMADLFAAADLAVFDSGGPGPTQSLPAAPEAAVWPVAWAHSFGVPVVAPSWAAVDGGLFTPAVAASCLAHSAVLPELARTLLPLITDAPLRERLSADVRDTAAVRTAGERFCSQVERAWENGGAPA